MSTLAPTRSAWITLGDERRSLREGYAFLDEKCMLLAGAILREIERWREAKRRRDVLRSQASQDLKAALLRLGLEGLQCYPAVRPDDLRVEIASARLLGIPLQTARLRAVTTNVEGRPDPNGVPEAEQARVSFSALLAHCTEMAAMAGNIERLSNEYRRTLRRTRAIQDVLLPELDRDLREIDTTLEELEREEASWTRCVRSVRHPS